MKNKDIVREQNYINRIEVFKERTRLFFANYENLSGGEECLEVCLIRDGCRAVSQAEKTINRLQAENERLKPFEDKIAEFNSHIRVEDMLVFASSLGEWLEFCEKLKAKAYKECIEKVKEKAYTYSDITGYQSTVVDVCEIDGVYEELVGEDDGEEEK